MTNDIDVCSRREKIISLLNAVDLGRATKERAKVQPAQIDTSKSRQAFVDTSLSSSILHSDTNDSLTLHLSLKIKA